MKTFPKAAQNPAFKTNSRLGPGRKDGGLNPETLKIKDGGEYVEGKEDKLMH